jgi:hypothetical protein
MRESTGVGALDEPAANPWFELPSAQFTVRQGLFRITAFLAVPEKQSAG